MRGHDRIDSSLDGFAERRQIDRLQLRRVVVDSSYGQMGVRRRVAVAGEMFGGRHHSARPCAADISRHQVSYLLRIFPKGTRTDNWVRGIGIHVGHRKEIPMHAQRTALLCGDAAELLGIGQFASGPEGHGMRKDGGSKKTRRKNTPLEVAGNQQRQARFCLQLIQQRDGLIAAVAGKIAAFRRHGHGQRTDVVFANVVTKLQVVRTLTIHELHPQANHEKLSDFFLEG